MDEDGTGSFARFVATERPALLRTALLLSGDRARAEELVAEALRVAVRRRDGDTAAHVRRALVRAATGGRRWSSAEQVLRERSAAGDAGTEGTAAALRDLPPLARAAVVLRTAEDRSEEEAARLLDLPPETVREQAARGLERLQEALGARGPAAVRGRLLDLAETPVRWRQDAEAAAGEVLRRSRRSRVVRVAAAAAAVAVLALAVPRGLDALGGGPAAVPARGAAPGTSAPPDAPVLTGPPRGSLAGDGAFLDAVRRVGWGAQDPPPESGREVVLATDTPDGRVALVVGTYFEDFRAVWLTGPPGAPPETLTPSVPRRPGRDRPAMLVLGGPDPATLLVVAGREDRIEVSDRLKVGPLGTVSRTYEPVPAQDGVAVVPVRTTTAGVPVSVRVLRGDRVVYRGGVERVGAPPSPAAPPVLEPLRPGAGPADPALVAGALTEVAVPLGVEAEALGPELLWAGESRDGSGGSVAVLVTRSPGGGLVVATWAGRGARRVACGAQTPAGATPVAEVVVARVCDLSPPGHSHPEDRLLVVTAPPAAVSADVLDAGGTVLTTLRLDGGAVVREPIGARSVIIRDTTRTPFAAVPVAAVPTQPFGDFGSGPAG